MAESAITFQRRYERLRHEGAIRCPDCNEELLSRGGVRIHKARGACTVVPGARARVAVIVAAAIAGRRI